MPVADVADAFEALQDEAHHSLERLLEYFEDYNIGRPGRLGHPRKLRRFCTE
mgnify:CR=1 FL=1